MSIWTIKCVYSVKIFKEMRVIRYVINYRIEDDLDMIGNNSDTDYYSILTNN